MATGVILFAFTCAIAGIHSLVQSLIRNKDGAAELFAFAFTICLGMLAGPGGREFAECIIPAIPQEIEYEGIEVKNPVHE